MFYNVMNSDRRDENFGSVGEMGQAGPLRR